jgi:integrase
MSRVRDLWHDKDRRKTARHPDNGGNPKAKRWLAVWAAPDGRETAKAFAKQSDAVKWAAVMEGDVLRGAYIDPKAARITVAQWCETWLAGYATRRASTVRQARVHVKQITAEFGSLPLAAVRPSQVKAWTSRLLTGGMEPSYVYALHARLAQVMSDAVHDGILAKSPCSRRTSPGQGQQRPYVATTDQVCALHDAMPQRLRAAILLGAFAGLRLAESCGLRVAADVNFMRGVIRPTVQYPAEELKTEISRTAIPVAASMALELAAHVARWPGEWLLCGRDGGQLPPWALERAIRTARAHVRKCEACGIIQAGSAAKFRCAGCGADRSSAGLPDGFRYHDLRHYLASLLIASGADVKVVQARLRHASAKTTLDCYGHLWPDSDESTRAAIDAVLAARAEQSRNRQATS